MEIAVKVVNIIALSAVAAMILFALRSGWSF